MDNVFGATTLYVKFIPISMSEDELRNLFQHFGTINTVNVSVYAPTRSRGD